MRKRKSNLMLRLASLLLACVIISTYALCGLLARYTTSSSSEDSARVAKFEIVDVTESGDFVKSGDKNIFYIIPGTTLKKDVTIDFKVSETSAYVFVEMILADNVGGWTRTENASGDIYALKISGADMLSFSVESGTGEWKYHTTETINDYLSGINATRYVYYKEVAAHDKIDAEDFIANNGQIVVSPNITRTMIKNGNFNNLHIDIRAIAAQSSGFNNLADAWESVKND